MLVAAAPAHVRALVHDLVRKHTATASPFGDVQAFVCLAAAARAAGIETKVEHELEGALGRALEARRSSGAHIELRAAVTRALGAISFEYTAPFHALRALAAGFLLAPGGQVRFRIVQGLVAVGDLDGAREASERLVGFERRRALRVVERGVVRGASRAKDRFVGLLAPPFLARLVPSAEAVAALGRRSMRAYEPWLATETARICEALDERELRRASSHSSVVSYFAHGRQHATRAALAISSGADRANAFLLLARAALRRGDTAFALELAERLGGTMRHRVDALLGSHVRPRSPTSASFSTELSTGIALLPTTLARWLTRVFDEVRVGQHRPLFALGASGAHDRPPHGEASDPLSLERARFDEGVAASPRGASRRSVLVRAAKHALKRALEGAAVDPRAVAARLRTLERLGGTLACDALEAVIAAARLYQPVVGEAIGSLAAIDPQRGASAFVRTQRIVTTRSDLERLLVSLEHAGAIERGFARAWIRLRDRLAATRTDAAATDWLARAVERCTALGLPLSVVVANAFYDALAGHSERRNTAVEPDRIVARALAELEALDSLPRERHLARLLGEPRLVDDLRAFRPARLGTFMTDWDHDRVVQAIGALWPAPDSTVDEMLVERFVRTTTRRHVDERTHALLAGRCPIEGASALDLGGDLRLRWLDKRVDLLAHLRFADIVPCCLSSAELDSRDVLFTWWDPLSFVCLVEKRDSLRPVGFVLGGFAWKGSTADPAMVVNGLYLARSNPRVRAGIVDALEHRIARPLGLVALGIAAIHGGRGPLPERYVQERARIERLRALRNARGLTWELYDDVCDIANVPISVDHLYWHQLRENAVRVLRRYDMAS